LRRAQNRDLIYVETNDAGALSALATPLQDGRGQLRWRWTADGRRKAKEADQRQGFSVKGEASLDRVGCGRAGRHQNGISFSRLRGNSPGRTAAPIREGVVKGPMIGGTIEGNIDFPGNQVRMSGTLIPMYGLNNMFARFRLWVCSRRRQKLRGCSV